MQLTHIFAGLAAVFAIVSVGFSLKAFYHLRRVDRTATETVAKGLADYGQVVRQQRDDAREEVRRLMDVIVEMKRDGFHPAPTPDPMPNPEPDLPSQITEAIMARSTRKSDLERELYRYAIRTYTGQNAEEIASTIWHGGDPQEDE